MTSSPPELAEIPMRSEAEAPRAAVTADDLIVRTREIAPILRQNLEQGERERRLPRETMDAMLSAGLFRIWTPKAYGGLELDPIDALRVFEEVSTIDGAAGWNLQLSSSITPAFAWFSDACTDEVFAEGPDMVLGGTLFPPGRAVSVDGGYLLSGRWPFSSGSHHASWLIAPGIVTEGEIPRRAEHGEPEELTFCYRAEQAEILDTWDTLGLRATGSHDVVARDIFVPHHRATRFIPLQEPARAFRGGLYQLTIWPTTAALAAPALGIARAALEELRRLATRKTPAYTKSSLRERPTVQEKAARATALVNAGRAYLYDTLRAASEAVTRGGSLPLERKRDVLLATVHAIRSAADAVVLVHEVAGTSAVRNQADFQRHFRDIHVITQHAFASTSRYESIGKLLFELETDWSFFEL